MSIRTPVWPLELDSQGRFRMLGDDSQVWGSWLNGLLTTRHGERPMRSTYGSDLADALMDQQFMVTPINAVQQAVTQWLPAVTVRSVKVQQMAAEFKVTVSYVTPSGSEEVLTTAFSEAS